MRALIIDDQPLIVSGLQAVMASLQTPVETSCAESADAARRLLASDMHFDFVLLDLDLAGSGGLNFFSELRRTYPAMSIVVLLESNSNELVSRLVVMGATGFLFKRASRAMLIDALHLAISGVVHVPPTKPRSQAPASSGLRGSFEGLRVGNPSPVRRLASARGLTSRQTDVLELLVLGQSNKLIARTLNLSVETVKDHVAVILRVLNVTSRTHVVLAMIQSSEETRHLADAASFRSVSQSLTSDGLRPAARTRSRSPPVTARAASTVRRGPWTATVDAG